VAGATIAQTPAAGKICYTSDGLPSASANATEDLGVAFALSAPAGETVLEALAPGYVFEANTFEVFAGGVSFTIIHP
jgi:hypothetical protein